MSRDRLLDAALRIVLEESLSDLSIDRVTAGAGLSRRTFFLHFSSKDQLIAEMLERLRPAFAERFTQWADGIDPSLPPEDRIIAMMQKVVEGVRDPDWRGCAFVRVSAEFGERPGHPVHAAVAGANRDLAEWLGTELARSGLRTPQLLARQLLLAINGLMIMQLVHRDASSGDAFLQLTASLLAGAKAVS